MRLTLSRVRALAAAGVLVATIGGTAVAASAQVSIPLSSASGTNVVLGETVTTAPEPSPNVSASQASAAAAAAATANKVLGETVSTGGVAFTGADITGAVGLGIILIGGGSLLLLTRRGVHAHSAR